MRVLLSSTHANGSTPVIVNGIATDIAHGVPTPVTAEQLHNLQNATLEGITLTELDDEEPVTEAPAASPAARRGRPPKAPAVPAAPVAPFEPGKFAPVNRPSDAIIEGAKALSVADLQALIGHLSAAKRPRAKVVEGLTALLPKE